jgi:hypothetical protein
MIELKPSSFLNKDAFEAILFFDVEKSSIN